MLSGEWIVVVGWGRPVALGLGSRSFITRVVFERMADERPWHPANPWEPANDQPESE